DGLVDVALALFLGGRLDVEVDDLLAIDDRHPELFRLGGVEQHAFHERSSAQAPRTGGGEAERAARTRRSSASGRRPRARTGRRAPGGAGGRERCARAVRRSAFGSIPAGGGGVGSRQAASSSCREQAVKPPAAL